MLFSKKEIALSAVCAGEAMPLSEMPDEAFSTGILGVGYAIEPSDGQFYAPATGRIENVAESKHAYTLTTDDGLDILIHIGVDTVKIGGEGFTSDVKEGARVHAGEPLAYADLSLIRSRGLPTVTAVLVANPERIEHVGFQYGAVSQRDSVMRFRLKKKG